MTSSAPTTTATSATPTYFWLWVMCLTGVDYFSTLAYQPSIAFEAAGNLAPLATIILVATTLFGALPVYWYVAKKSPHGQGSISMLESLLEGWHGKILVLVLLGFAMTDYVITKTLSAADAAQHLIHNPLWKGAPDVMQNQVALTMGFLILLGGIFLRGFHEVIAVAVFVVSIYLALNLFVIGSGWNHLISHPALLSDWFHNIRQGNWELESAPLECHGWISVIAVSLLLFPKLALGLSGFETGVAVMPLVRGQASDSYLNPKGRIANAQKLLLTAAVIMSVLLLGSTFVTTTLIDPEALRTGEAKDRALAFIAHGQTAIKINPLFGELFGTIYDLSTIAILWFAGASAMSGLLNLVPRYLPRYGMAPRWVEAHKPLVIMFTIVNLVVTLIFKADVTAQGGAYATGVMVLISTACVAVLIDKIKTSQARVLSDARPSQLTRVIRFPWYFLFVGLVFIYITIDIVIEKSDGIKIALAFICAVIVVAIYSRTRRSTELRFEGFQFVDHASHMLWDSLKDIGFPVLVPHRPGGQPIAVKEIGIRKIHRLEPEVPIVFVEIQLGDTSDFGDTPTIEVLEEDGRFIVRATGSVSIAHTLASMALELSQIGKPPEIHFGWSNESAFTANLGFLLFGEGNVPWLVRELINNAEPNPDKRPRVIVG